MNYYQHHIGDYAAATAHLTLLEDAVFSRLLRRYYLQESPLPADVAQTARLAGARSVDEIAAVDAVLREFFTLTDDGWRNKRADKEIAAYRDRADTARNNGKRGGRKPSPNPAGTQRVNSANPAGTGSQANQEPITNNHTKAESKAFVSPDGKTKTQGSRLAADWVLPADWRDWAEAQHPGTDADAEAAKFGDYWRSQPGAKGRKTDWLATWRNWIRNAGERRTARAGPAAGPSKHLTGMAGFLGVDPHELARSNANPRLVLGADSQRTDGALRALPGGMPRVGFDQGRGGAVDSVAMGKIAACVEPGARFKAHSGGV